MLDNVILFFDSACLLCNKSVQWILKNENNPAIKFCSLQSSFASLVIPAEYKNIDTVILLKNQKYYIYLDVLIHIIPYLKWYWKVLYIIVLLPPFFRKKIYQWIAHHRKKWFGTTEECFLLANEWKNRFIS